MHIVHINFSITIGGIDTMLVDILNEQIKTTKTTLVIINNNIEEAVLKNLNSKISVVRIGRKEGSKDLLKIINFNYIIFKLKPSVIHCHNSKIVNLLMLKKFPIVLTVHDVKSSTELYHKYVRIFAISEAVKADIQKNGKFPVVTVYNGVNDELITPKDDTKEREEFRLIIVSRLEHIKKGHDIVFKAIKNLGNKYNFTIDLIGHGNSLDFLVNLSEELNIQNNVRFLGVKSREYIYNNLKNYDLLIQPSRYEGFGLTVVEAMLAKVLVLASDIDGPVEILNNGEFGICFKSGDLDDLISKLEYIFLNHTIVNTQYIEKAYIRAKSCFSIQNTAMSYIKNYNELIN